MKDIIVTGGRDFDDYNKVAEVLELFDIGLIIQGGASGADSLAKRYATLADIECKTFEADWNKHGKAAGPIRNRLMLIEHPNAVVVAFPGGRGTANCIEQALKAGMLVLEVR